MKVHNKLRLSLSGSLVAAACVGLWFASSPLALAGGGGGNPPPNGSLDCLYKTDYGDTGCISDGNCSIISPNKGILWVADWKCCYDSNQNLVNGSDYSCGWSTNGGCCNFIETSSHCPPLSCPGTKR